MSRLKACFEKLKQEKRKALVPYIVAGDPEAKSTLGFMHAMVESGASVIELGVPFSDPMADGPLNQLGHERALANGISLHDVLAIVSEFRKKDQLTPIVLMGYLNPIEIYGYEAFAKDASAAGVDGLLTVDLPPEESEQLSTAVANLEIDLIYLVAPTTTLERIKTICDAASGFIYYVSLKGVTGAGHLDVKSIESKVSEISANTSLPIMVGFGIKDAASASAVSALAQGVIVGSVLVDQCGAEDKSQIENNLSGIIASMRSAMDEG